MEKKNVSKNKTTKKGNIEKAILNTVEPDVQHTVQPVVKSTKIVKQVVEPIEKRTNEPVVKSTKIVKQVVEPIEKRTNEPVVIQTVQPVEPVLEHVITPNNRDKPVDLNILNKSHEKILKKCTNNNFNIFD
jgi:hypothetical protein